MNHVFRSMTPQAQDMKFPFKLPLFKPKQKLWIITLVFLLFHLVFLLQENLQEL